jgi:very-short-patch-repair endonuclease/transposase
MVYTKKRISDFYRSGLSYREIQTKTGCSYFAICKAVKEILGKCRSTSESGKLAKAKYIMSDETRQKLSNAGKKSILNSKKIWTKPEQKFKDILNSINIGVKFPECLLEIYGEGENDGEIFFQYPLQRYICDFVDPERKIVYQVNGDFWHANPILYDSKNLNKIQLNNVRHDRNREQYLKSKGYTVCILWESEIYWNVPLVIEKVRASRKMANPSRLHREDIRIDTGDAQSDWSEILRSLWFKKPRKQKETIKVVCKQCGKEFDVSADNKKEHKRKFCGYDCSSMSRRRVCRPDRDQLLVEINTMSWRAVGRKYNVSDNAVRKWARDYGLT